MGPPEGFGVMKSGWDFRGRFWHGRAAENVKKKQFFSPLPHGESIGVTGT
jgi:hypothetical protein